MRILVTRPAEDAAALIASLISLGHDPIAAPVMRIAFFAGPRLDLRGAQGFLATSANGVRALGRRTDNRILPVFAVGDATAGAAETVGRARRHSAKGNVETLADLVIETADPKAGALLHAAGETLAGDLAGFLRAAGFSYRRETGRAEPASVLDRACGTSHPGRDRGSRFASVPRSAESSARWSSGPAAAAARASRFFLLERRRGANARTPCSTADRSAPAQSRKSFGTDRTGLIRERPET